MTTTLLKVTICVKPWQATFLRSVVYCWPSVHELKNPQSPQLNSNLQIFTRLVPFYYKAEKAIPFLVTRGKLPKRPSEDDCGGHPMPDHLWDMALECWSMQPNNRPNMQALLETLDGGVI
jgi:hypothetical protein